MFQPASSQHPSYQLSNSGNSWNHTADECLPPCARWFLCAAWTAFVWLVRSWRKQFFCPSFILHICLEFRKRTVHMNCFRTNKKIITFFSLFSPSATLSQVALTWQGLIELLTCPAFPSKGASSFYNDALYWNCIIIAKSFRNFLSSVRLCQVSASDLVK